jgi:hypothetical protein
VFGDHTNPQHRWCEACRNPYVLGGVGAAIVAGVVTAIIIATRPTPQPTVTIDPTGFTH